MKIWKEEEGWKELGLLIELRLNDSGEEVLRFALAKQLLNRIVVPLGLIVQVASIELERIVSKVLAAEKLTSAGNFRSKYPPIVIGSFKVIENV